MAVRTAIVCSAMQATMFSRSKQLKVGKIHTSPVLARVVKVHPFGDWADLVLVDEPVSDSSAPIFAIAITTNRPVPDDTLAHAHW
jgi:hypothetical protein